MVCGVNRVGGVPSKREKGIRQDTPRGGGCRKWVVSLLNELVQSIKQAAVEAVEAAVPVAVFVGTVEPDAPFAVRLDQRLTLTRRRLVLLEGQAVPVAGQRVALLRFAGGQQYLVLGVLA